MPRKEKNAPRRTDAEQGRSLFFPGGGLGRVAVLGQGAALAPGGPGGAGVPAEEDQPVAEVVGLLGRDALAQLPLHLEGILGPIGDAQPPGDADAVGVADIALLAEYVPFVAANATAMKVGLLAATLAGGAIWKYGGCWKKESVA